MEQVIVTKLQNGLGKITLNRPEALHALNTNMIQIISETLTKWQQDDEVQVVLFDATGDRAFCAGGDIKAFYTAKQQGATAEEMAHFFEVEYQLDGLVAQFTKPIVANLDGIVMGGGVGLTYGADYKIVTENTKWAMPEMNISFFPDVGAAYFLNQTPGMVGRYVALSAKTFTASDVLYMKTANLFMKHDQLQNVLSELESTNWNRADQEQLLGELIASYETIPDEQSVLATYKQKIDGHFQYNTVEEIVDSLAKDESEFAQETKKLLLSHSPLSLKVTLEMLIRSENKSFLECLQTDYVIAKNFLDDEDFYEGVRSVLVDKDRNPTYKYKDLTSVPYEVVQSFFVD